MTQNANPALVLTLPYPPTVNSYYRRVLIGRNPRTLISEAGRLYRHAVKELLYETHGDSDVLEGLLAVSIEVCAPDRRKRDLDNACKALLDSLTHAGVWGDDSQIDDLRIYRKRASSGELVAQKPGHVVVTVWKAGAT